MATATQDSPFAKELAEFLKSRIGIYSNCIALTAIGAEIDSRCIERNLTLTRAYIYGTSNDGFMYIHIAMTVYVLDSIKLVSKT